MMSDVSALALDDPKIAKNINDAFTEFINAPIDHDGTRTFTVHDVDASAVPAITSALDSSSYTILDYTHEAGTLTMSIAV